PPRLSRKMRGNANGAFRSMRYWPSSGSVTLSSPASTCPATRCLKLRTRVGLGVGDEVAQLRVDRLAPPPPAEDAVVASALDRHAPLARVGGPRATGQRRRA